MLSVLRFARRADVALYKIITKRAFSTSFKLLSYQQQILTDEQLSEYHQNGYIILKDLLTPAEKADVTRIMDEIQAWPHSDDKWFTHYEHINGKKTISRIENFYLYHPRLKDLVTKGKLGQAVADCLGERGVMFKDKINFKFPGSIGYDAHQDEPGWLMSNQGFHLSALIAADPMTIDNGCLKLVAGDWKEGRMLPLDDNGDIPEEIAQEFKWDPIVCDPGTITLFTSLVPHKSDINRSDSTRRAFYLTFNGISKGDCHQKFYDMRREMFPSDHMRDPNKDYSEGIELISEQILEMGKGNIEKVQRGNY